MTSKVKLFGILNVHPLQTLEEKRGLRDGSQQDRHC